MINHLRLNWPMYETDILFLGGTVTYTGNVCCKSKRSSLSEANIVFCGRHFHVWMECFKDGTAAVSKVNGRTEELYELYEKVLLVKENELYSEYVFLRFVKQFWLFIAQIVLLIICICNIVTFVSHKSATHLLVSVISLFMTILLGALFSKIRCYSFDIFNSVEL